MKEQTAIGVRFAAQNKEITKSQNNHKNRLVKGEDSKRRRIKKKDQVSEN